MFVFYFVCFEMAVIFSKKKKLFFFSNGQLQNQSTINYQQQYNFISKHL